MAFGDGCCGCLPFVIEVRVALLLLLLDLLSEGPSSLRGGHGVEGNGGGGLSTARDEYCVVFGASMTRLGIIEADETDSERCCSDRLENGDDVIVVLIDVM